MIYQRAAHGGYSRSKRGSPDPAYCGSTLRARLLMFLLLTAAAPTTEPALWADLQKVDALATASSAVSADFRQEKFTPLLKKPLVSTGHVTARGDVSLWKTDLPRPSAMRVSPAEMRIYYPDQSTVEVYPVQGELGALAASPLPRLSTLRRFFTFERMDAADANLLAVRLTPSADELKQHVREVRVQLDRTTGAIRRAETVNADGDRTVLTFDHVDLHATATDDDLKLTVPAGVTETHPLAGVGK